MCEGVEAEAYRCFLSAGSSFGETTCKGHAVACFYKASVLVHNVLVFRFGVATNNRAVFPFHVRPDNHACGSFDGVVVRQGNFHSVLLAKRNNFAVGFDCILVGIEKFFVAVCVHSVDLQHCIANRLANVDNCIPNNFNGCWVAVLNGLLHRDGNGCCFGHAVFRVGNGHALVALLKCGFVHVVVVALQCLLGSVVVDSVDNHAFVAEVATNCVANCVGQHDNFNCRKHNWNKRNVDNCRFATVGDCDFATLLVEICRGRNVKLSRFNVFRPIVLAFLRVGCSYNEVFVLYFGKVVCVVADAIGKFCRNGFQRGFWRWFCSATVIRFATLFLLDLFKVVLVLAVGNCWNKHGACCNDDCKCNDCNSFDKFEFHYACSSSLVLG